MNEKAEHHLHEYLAHLTVERNLSPRTVDSYRRDLLQFISWLDEQSMTLDKVERATLRNYLGSRRDHGLSARSAARALSSLRGFFRFLVNSQAQSADPTANLRSPSLWRTVPHALSADEIDASGNLAARCLDQVLDLVCRCPGADVGASRRSVEASARLGRLSAQSTVDGPWSVSGSGLGTVGLRLRVGLPAREPAGLRDRAGT